MEDCAAVAASTTGSSAGPTGIPLERTSDADTSILTTGSASGTTGCEGAVNAGAISPEDTEGALNEGVIAPVDTEGAATSADGSYPEEAEKETAAFCCDISRYIVSLEMGTPAEMEASTIDSTTSGDTDFSRYCEL